jgi:hypothetical protein
MAQKHYPLLHNLLDILDAEPQGAPDAPPTQAEKNLATALEELKLPIRLRIIYRRIINPYMIKMHAYLAAVHAICCAFCHQYQVWE